MTAVFLTIVWAQKHRLRRSYADLYTVNRNLIDTQEQLTVRLRTANEALKAANEELAAVKSYEEKMGGFNGGHTKKQPKYQSSCLAGEQARMLADAIRNVMEDTTMYCNCNFSLGMLADAVGSNSKYVSQVINDIFHKTFNDYVNPYRIHLACARFADTEHYGHLTMKAVAESVGFKSYSSFVSVFRKVTGISPSLYQSMALKEKSSVNA